MNGLLVLKEVNIDYCADCAFKKICIPDECKLLGYRKKEEND